MYVCMYVCASLLLMYVVCVFIYVCNTQWLYVGSRSITCIRVIIHTYPHIRIFVNTHIYIYTFIHSYIHIDYKPGSMCVSINLMYI